MTHRIHLYKAKRLSKSATAKETLFKNISDLNSRCRFNRNQIINNNRFGISDPNRPVFKVFHFNAKEYEMPTPANATSERHQERRIHVTKSKKKIFFYFFYIGILTIVTLTSIDVN
jgi:hypothetical protein